MDINSKKEFTAPYALYIWLALGLGLLIMVLSTSGMIASTGKTKNTNITFIVDYGSSQKKFSGQFSVKVRVWDLLQQATTLSNTSLVATGNFIPYQIDGHQSNTKEGWNYYMNGVLQSAPPFEMFAVSGDEVVFKWEAYDDAHPKRW